MRAGRRGWKAIAGLAIVVATAQAAAQDKPYRPAGSEDRPYRCTSGGSVTYSQIPCPGGRPIGTTARRTSDKWTPPPQDRAVIARRSRLSPEERQQCRSLDGRMAAEERLLKSRGESVTLQDELPLVQMKKQFRELKC